MKLLLDTHIWLWRLLDPARVPAPIEAALAADGSAYLSPISVWETLVLARKGRLVLRPEPEAWVLEALRAAPTVMIPVTHAIALRTEQLPDFPSADPGDRFLAATAIEHDLVLATADRRLQGYQGLRTIA